MYAYNKRTFQLAYRWMYGETLTKGAEVYKKAKEKGEVGYIKRIIDAYMNNFHIAFYTD